jgi:hypothetical protein
MGGGLIQIATYSAQDIFLTGNPQVSFFKTVYRRYTNFAVETISLPFEGTNIGFGGTVTCPVDKCGDLLLHASLAVDVAAVTLPRPIAIPDPTLDLLSQTLQTTQTNYQIMHAYVGLMLQLYRASVGQIQSYNNASVSNVQQTISSLLSTLDPNQTITNNFINLIAQDCPAANSPLYSASNLSTALNLLQATNNISAANLTAQFNLVIDTLMALENQYWDSYRQAQIAYQQETNLNSLNSGNSANAKFAWIKKLGHYLQEYIDLEIGGNRIDRQYGEWIQIWHELTGRWEQEEGYRALIGDVPEMTDFSPVPKPSRTIITPIPFWFNRDNGLSLPLICLNYYKIRFVVKFKQMQEVSYTNFANLLDPDDVRLCFSGRW